MPQVSNGQCPKIVNRWYPNPGEAKVAVLAGSTAGNEDQGLLLVHGSDHGACPWEGWGFHPTPFCEGLMKIVKELDLQLTLRAISSGHTIIFDMTRRGYKEAAPTLVPWRLRVGSPGQVAGSGHASHGQQGLNQPLAARPSSSTSYAVKDLYGIDPGDRTLPTVLWDTSRLNIIEIGPSGVGHESQRTSSTSMPSACRPSNLPQPRSQLAPGGRFPPQGRE